MTRRVASLSSYLQLLRVRCRPFHPLSLTIQQRFRIISPVLSYS